MARIYNPEKYGDLYQPRAQSRGFQAETAINQEKQFQKQGEQQLRDIETLARADARQATIDNGILKAQQGMQNAKMTRDAAVLKGVLSLSQTAIKGFQEQQALQEKAAKEQEKQDKINGLLGAAGITSTSGGVVDIPNETFEADADARAQIGAEASGINQTAAGIESQGTPQAQSLANQLRQGGIHKNFSYIQGDMYKARGAHALYLQEAIQALPDDMKPRTASEAAIMVDQLNQQFIQSAGIGAGNPALLAEVLAPTMIQNNANMVSKLTAAGVKADQTSNLSALGNSTFNLISSNASAEEIWRHASDGHAFNNVGYMGHSAASNQAALEMILKGAVTGSDPNLVERLRNVPKGPGLPTLGEEFPLLFADYAKKAQNAGVQDWNRGQTQGRMAVQQIQEDYFKNPSPEGRERAYEELMALGTPQAYAAATKLAGANGDQLNRDIELEVDIARRFREGTPPSQSQLKEWKAEGRISDSVYKEWSQNPEQIAAQKQVNSQMTTSRAKLDDMIEANINGGTATVFANASQSFKNELALRQTRFNLEVKQRVEALVKQNPDLANDPLLLNQAVFDEAEQLLKKKEYQMQFSSTEAKWQFLGETASNSKGLAAVKQYTIAQNQQDFTSFSAVEVMDDMGVPRGMINPEDDLLIPKSTLQKDVKALLSGNPRNMTLHTLGWAEKLGVSPQAFLDAQLKRYGLPSSTDLRKPPAAAGADPVGTDGNIQNTQQGYSHLQSMGFPQRGSAYIASAIQHESGWNGQRAWGEVAGDGTDRNGGLISWQNTASANHWRLRNVERHFGKDISQIPEDQQLQYMKMEMRKSYPQAYRIFNDPNASSGDLQWAVRNYWGFDPKYTGNRWRDAEALLGKGSGPQPAGERSFTGALTFTGNREAYRSVGNAFQAAGFRVGEQSLFDKVDPVHSGNSYHKYDEAFDVTHQTGDYATSIAKTKRLKDVVRNLGLFKEVIGPGDGDPDHETHLHLGGLMRPMTPADIAAIRAVS